MMLMNSRDWLIMRPPDDAPVRHHGKIEMAEILRTMIAAEVRHGRLTPKRRKRIIQFASQLGISPVQAGNLLQACCEESNEDSIANRISLSELKVIPCAESEPDPLTHVIERLRLRRTTAYFAIAAGCVMLILFVFVRLSVM